jgi:UDP-4-amino-4,6-dideoxy-N-acetyl-beta-L-altrosamine N-acetyltransferase
MNILENGFENYNNGTLIALTEKYLKTVFEWRNSPRIRDSMFTNSEISWNEHLSWFEKIRTEEKDFHYIFLYKDIPKGFLYFNECDSKENTLNWGFYMGSPQEKMGLSYLMGILGLKIAFNKAKIDNILGEVLEYNTKSLRYHLQLGFSLKSNELQHKYDKKYFLFEYSKSEWKNKNSSIEKKLKELFNEVFTN